jgi:hypothetical protein
MTPNREHEAGTDQAEHSRTDTAVAAPVQTEPDLVQLTNYLAQMESLKRNRPIAAAQPQRYNLAPVSLEAPSAVQHVSSYFSSA